MIKILKYGEVANNDIFARVTPTVNVEEIVADIIANVRKNGDKALYEYCGKFDKVKLDALSVSPEEIEAAFARFKGPRYHVIGGGEKSAGGERGSARDGGGAGPCVQQLRRRRNLAFGRVHGDGMAQRADRAANRAGTGARHGLTPWDRPRRSTPFTSAARSAGSRHRPPGRTPSCARAAPCWAGGASASGVPGGR